MTYGVHLVALQRLRRALPWMVSVLGVLLVLKLTLGGHLMYTVTGSIPRGIYWITLSHHAGRGDLVTFPIPESVRDLIYERRYLPPTVKVLAKPVAAAAGDRVCLRGEHLVINDRVITAIRSHDSQGRPLPHPELCRSLAEGELFVATSHENSFDSRHFGPIASSQLRGTLTPILTFRCEPVASR
jgi:conjugative transfer signal peptidase TraF